MIALALAAALVAGCGGDDEPAPSSATPSAAAPTSTATATVAPLPSVAPDETPTAEPTPRPTDDPRSPEDQPGGAGDEEARAPAALTGRGGRISPRVVRVPPYIAIRVELRSADRRSYGLDFGTASLRTGRTVATATVTLDGLRPNEAVVGRPVGGGSRVRIVADAEPGP